jgi:hypothetical protein
MLGLKRPSVLSFVFSTYGKVSVNIRFAIDGDFDAGRRCRVRTSGSLISILLSTLASPLCARTNAMPRSAPAFALNLHNGYLVH